MKHIRPFLMIAVCLVSMTASAQWQWIDKDGRKVFSDRAPPPAIADKNILQRPAGSGVVAATADAPAPASSTAAPVDPAPQGAANAPEISGVDQELAEKKKKAEDAQAAQRKAEEARVLKAKVENCARAKQAKAGFASGVRIARTNANGEREVLDDAARAAEMKRIESIINSDCR